MHGAKVKIKIVFYVNEKIDIHLRDTSAGIFCNGKW
jgi:hypothetical protein